MKRKKESRLQAVAMRYKMDADAAPRVVAKGSGLLAQRIIDCARQHGVPLREDPDLVAALARLDINAEIPERLYLAMAEVLAFVYRLNAKAR